MFARVYRNRWWACKVGCLCREQCGGFPRKLIMELPYDTAIPLLGIEPKDENRYWNKYFYKSQKVGTTQMSVNGWMTQQNMAGTCNGILFSHKKQWSTVHATMRMNLKHKMLSERNQIHKVTCHTIPLIRNIQNRKIHRDRKQISCCQLEGWGRPA